MEHDALISLGALLQDLEAVLVGVAIVNLQGQTRPASHVDVDSEGLLLRLSPGFGGAEVVEAALSHRDDHRVTQAGLNRRKSLDEGNVVVARLRGQPVGRGLGAAGVQGGLVGVDRQGDAHARVGASEGQHGIEVRQLARARDHGAHADSAGTFQLFLQGETHAVRAGNLPDVGGQVGVVVDDGSRQRGGSVGPGTRLAPTHAG